MQFFGKFQASAIFLGAGPCFRQRLFSNQSIIYESGEKAEDNPRLDLAESFKCRGFCCTQGCKLGFGLRETRLFNAPELFIDRHGARESVSPMFHLYPFSSQPAKFDVKAVKKSQPSTKNDKMHRKMTRGPETKKI